jgi:very-short-patch-repair endonuclease
VNPMPGRWVKLTRDITAGEAALEPAVASLGVPYRFQYPMYLFGPLKYFPDFVLLDHKVIFEVDDPKHFTAEGRAKDKIRTANLKKAGYRVARVTNEAAIADPYGAVDRMCAEAGLTLRTARSGRPAPR